MKMSKSRNSGSGRDLSLKSGKPAANQSKKLIYVVLMVFITLALIARVYTIGKKAEETVKVCMTAQAIYKNQLVTENMLVEYDMLKGEFEKFSIVNTDGTKRRRIILWDERNLIINTFAAYPLQANNYCEYRSFITSRIDNSDTILYSFPGKDIVPLDIGTDNMNSFKTFLQPGDRVNIHGVFSEQQKLEEDDGFGGTTTRTVEVFRTEEVFKNILIADMLNGAGESVLDIYADYRDRTAYEQAQMDSSAEFKSNTQPSTLLVALTPEELTRYYYYKSKSNIEFTMSLPQRVE